MVQVQVRIATAPKDGKDEYSIQYDILKREDTNEKETEMADTIQTVLLETIKIACSVQGVELRGLKVI